MRLAMSKTNLTVKYLYRYTYIPDLLYMLQNGRLFLSDPDRWEDKTDAHFLKEYAKGKAVKALCLFENSEANLYWELYAKYGCMIVFNKELLLDSIDKSIFEYGRISYKKQNEFKLEKHKNKLPFIKQLRYKGEKEFRIVWTGEDEGKEGVSIGIDLNSIEKLVISGDIQEKLAKSLITAIHTITKNALAKKVFYSRLYNNKVWKNKLTSQHRSSN
jgi:hypothetical protein